MRLPIDITKLTNSELFQLNTEIKAELDRRNKTKVLEKNNFIPKPKCCPDPNYPIWNPIDGEWMNDYGVLKDEAESMAAESMAILDHLDSVHGDDWDC